MNAWQSRYSVLLDEFKDLRDGKVPELEARLAESEAALLDKIAEQGARLDECKDDYIRVHGERNAALAGWATDRTRLADEKQRHQINLANSIVAEVIVEEKLAKAEARLAEAERLLMDMRGQTIDAWDAQHLWLSRIDAALTGTAVSASTGESAEHE